MAPLPLSEYTTVFSQCFSPDGNYLVVGDDRGRVTLFTLEKIARNNQKAGLQIDDDDTKNKSQKEDVLLYRFEAHESSATPVLSMVSTEQELIIGTVGKITAWTWKTILKKSAKSSWSMELPVLANAGIQTDANYLAINQAKSTAGQLVVAGGDYNVHVFDLETRRSLHKLCGHENFVHCVSLDGEAIASGSEDGTARLWDVRQKRPNTATLKPHEKPSLERHRIGKWMGAVSLSSDWLACGGGPRAALWHLRTLTPSEPLPPYDSGVHEIKIVGERIILGGETNKMFHTNLQGDVIAEVPISSTCLYSIVCQEAPLKALSCAGSSGKLDICMPNFSYKNCTIDLPL